MMCIQRFYQLVEDDELLALTNIKTNKNLIVYSISEKVFSLLTDSRQRYSEKSRKG
jgi:hypothetical protein